MALAAAACVSFACQLALLSAPQRAERPSAAPDNDERGAPVLYDELREARLTYAGHIRDGRFRADRFQFDLIDGDLYLLEPVAGRVTGGVFLGEGRLLAYPPDAVEHQQLKKHVDADRLEETFDRVVVRFSDDTDERLRALVRDSSVGDDSSGSAARGVGRANGLFEDRRKKRFDTILANPDSRILADLLDGQDHRAGSGPDSGYFLALIDGDDQGWFSVEIEPRDFEEVSVNHYDERYEMVDVWMGFHALEDMRNADGVVTGLDPFAGFPIAPDSLDKDDDEISGRDLGLPIRPEPPVAENWRARADVPVAAADVSLESNGKMRGAAALLIEPRVDLASVRLRLSQWLQATDVRWRDAPAVELASWDRPSPPGDQTAGAEASLLARSPAPGPDAEYDPADPVSVSGDRLRFVQERRSRAMTDDWFEPWVTVELPRRVRAGEAFVLEIAYEGKLLERLLRSGDHVLLDTLFWVPKHPDSRQTRFDLTFRVRERDSVVGSGDLIEDRVEEGTRIIRRRTRSPARYASFHYGQFDVTEVEADGLPVSIYADRYRVGTAPGITRTVVENLIGALRTQAAYFGPYPFPSLQVTETPTTSGQAFQGFLLLSYQSFGDLHDGEAELFRSHEVAHQWWGAGVQWHDYRDQWLSEGFAQYGAALYVRSGLEDEVQFRDMLTAWRYDVLGEVNLGQGRGGHYGFRPAVIRRSQGFESGPLAVGFRLQSSETPYDYRLLVYEKGAFVLHMLRTMLLEPETGDDGRFRELMTRFASDHMHGVVTTDQFERAVSEAFGEPMDWFFDQWVYGVEVPTYRPRLEVVAQGPGADPPYVLRGTVRQEDVFEGFKMPVPIAFRFDDGPPVIHQVWIDQESVDVEIPLPARPSDVEFNYQNGVLAKVK